MPTETPVDATVIILTVGSVLPPRKQAFLDLLAARASGRETAPASPPPEAEPGGAPELEADGAPPLTFEEQPPAVEEVPPALTALAADEPVQAPVTESWEDTPRPDAQLMDLGADAQAQGTAMALRASAGTLASVIRDLGSLEYFDQASQLVPVMEWAVEEHNRLMAELEQRGRERRGET